MPACESVFALGTVLAPPCTSKGEQDLDPPQVLYEGVHFGFTSPIRFFILTTVQYGSQFAMRIDFIDADPGIVMTRSIIEKACFTGRNVWIPCNGHYIKLLLTQQNPSHITKAEMRLYDVIHAIEAAEPFSHVTRIAPVT